MKKKGITLILTVLFAMMTFTGCSNSVTKKTYGVLQDSEYDCIFLNVSINDFINSGFNFGDSLDISLSNGLTFEDVPFYSGYYVRTGELLVVGYPGYKYIAFTRNNQGLWTDSRLTEGDTIEISIHKTGKYLNEQETFSQSYSNNRDEYSSDTQFANFRALSGGNLKKNFLYRGASSVDNQKNRVGIVNSLLEEFNINFILNLADSKEEYLGFEREDTFSGFYAQSLYEDGKMALLDISSSYGSDIYKQRLVDGLKKMILNDGPIYIHCLEGKDRTGFVCLILEALAGASYEEMVNDYIKTYENYYGITKENDPNKYYAIVNLYFDVFVSYLHGTDDIKELTCADYTQDAINYLCEGGMTIDEISKLRNMITNN